jgi:hypothetical protein
MEKFTLRTFWTEAYKVVYTNFVVHIMNERTREPMNFTEPSLKVGTRFLSVSPGTWYTYFSARDTSSKTANIAQCPSVLELTFVSLMASPIFLKVAAWRDFIRVIYMQKLALVSLLALVAHPMDAYSPFSFTLIDFLLF